MYKSKKKINYDHLYILVISLIALVFIIAFAHENYCKNEEAKSYEREIQVQENTYQDLQKKYKTVNDKLKIITDEYHDLLERSE